MNKKEVNALIEKGWMRVLQVKRTQSRYAKKNQSISVFECVTELELGDSQFEWSAAGYKQQMTWQRIQYNAFVMLNRVG